MRAAVAALFVGGRMLIMNILRGGGACHLVFTRSQRGAVTLVEGVAAVTAAFCCWAEPSWDQSMGAKA